MKWKIACAILLATNAVTAFLVIKKQPRECRADARDIDSKLAEGWTLKSTVTQNVRGYDRTYYILTRSD